MAWAPRGEEEKERVFGGEGFFEKEMLPIQTKNNPNQLKFLIYIKWVTRPNSNININVSLLFQHGPAGFTGY